MPLPILRMDSSAGREWSAGAAMGRCLVIGHGGSPYAPSAGDLRVRRHPSSLHVAAESPAAGPLPSLVFLLWTPGRYGLAAAGGAAMKCVPAHTNPTMFGIGQDGLRPGRGRFEFHDAR